MGMTAFKVWKLAAVFQDPWTRSGLDLPALNTVVEIRVTGKMQQRKHWKRHNRALLLNLKFKLNIQINIFLNINISILPKKNA